MMNTHITMGYGSGGSLTQRLIKDLFLPAFNSPELNQLSDAALLDLSPGRVAFTTDSYVVKPLFFPGGDIGRLAVTGTANDLAVMGARPAFLSCGLIIHEGFSLSDLKKISHSMKEAALEYGIRIVTGDTKVIERGSLEGLYINTAGIGVLMNNAPPGRDSIQKGDAIIVSGDIGDHGTAIFAARENMKFESELKSDCAQIFPLVEKILSISSKVRIMRDPTRGGVGAVLNEFVENFSLGVELDEKIIPVKKEVQAICELLGFDPLYMACEGRVVIVVAWEDSKAVLDALRSHPAGKNSAMIGQVTENFSGRVTLRTLTGGERIVDMPSGELLPRIC